MPVIATWSPNDAVLDVLVPLGLIAAVPTGIVIDLDPAGPRPSGSWTLADLVREGPERRHLDAPRNAHAHLPNGGVAPEEAASVIAALVERWPATVLRCSPHEPRPDGAVAVVPLLPEPFTPRMEAPVVYQRTAFSPKAAPSGLTLPPPRRTTVARLLQHRTPPRDRWIRALAHLWSQA